MHGAFSHESLVSVANFCHRALHSSTGEVRLLLELDLDGFQVLRAIPLFEGGHRHNGFADFQRDSADESLEEAHGEHMEIELLDDGVSFDQIRRKIQ